MSTITIDKTRPYQPYFKAYARNFKHGEVVNVYEFISWINKKHRKFRELHKLGRKPYTAEQERQFLEFINN